MKKVVALLFLPFLLCSEIPDFTHGDLPPEKSKDWNLGATGLRGWIYSNKFSTTDARQIYVTKVDANSPAESKIKVGDVIIGLGKSKFKADARKSFGQALSKVEAANGVLPLIIYRKGKVKQVKLKIRTFGKYASTAPFSCKKSELILQDACKHIANKLKNSSKRPNWILRSSDALALLASGNQNYLPLIRAEVEEAAKYCGIETNSYFSWFYGPVATLIAEYTLATGDKSFLKSLERITSEIVDGQSEVGSWGHRFVDSNGRLRGYGMMNAPGIPLTISLVLARMAGVNNPELDSAIEKSCRLIRFYVGKGSIPYGDHHPWVKTHDDNGKNGMAAVLFNLIGDQEAATYFSRMSIASHSDEREMGHTGNFFNIQWGMPAVALSGKNATGSWMKKYGWYFDLARRWDGSFIHQGPAQKKKDKYLLWDSTGVIALAYAQKNRRIYLTGKKAGVIDPISSKVAKSLIKDGEGWSQGNHQNYYKERSAQELRQNIKSWSPIVRIRTAKELVRRDLMTDQEIIKLLENRNDLNGVIGGCEIVIEMKADAKACIPHLVKLLDEEHLWVKVKAVEGLAAIGKDALPTAPRLFKMFEEKSAEDPRGMLQRYLCFALFDRRNGLLRSSLEGVDRVELFEAVEIGLTNDDGRARGTISSIYKTLEFEELSPLFPAIIKAIKEPSPSGIMFAHNIRMAGLELLSRHRIEEGLELCVDYLKSQKKHGSEKRTDQVLKFLGNYGSHAQQVVPKLEKLVVYFENGEENHPRKNSRAKAQKVREFIEQVKNNESQPELRSLNDK